MVVCRKTFSSYTVVGEAVLEVSEEKFLHILSAERAFCGYPRKISHIKAWERLKKGVFAKKEISMQNMEDTEFVQIAQNGFSGKAA